MPKYQVEAPDGRILEIEGANPPTEQELDQIFQDISVSEPAQDVNTLSDVLEGGRAGLSEIPRAGAKLSNKYLRPMIGKEPLSQEELQQGLERFGAGEYEPKTLMGGISKTVGEVAPYFAMPQATLAESLSTGALAGGATAASQDKNALIGSLLGALGGGAVHGAGKGVKAIQENVITPNVDKGLLYLAGIKPYMTEVATEKGSKVLDLLKQIEKGSPEKEVQSIWENIRQPFNEQLLKTEKELGGNVGTAKQQIFENIGDVLKPGLDDVNKIISDIKKDPQYKGSILEDKLSNIVEEINKGISPERADKLTEILDKDIIKYGKELGDLGYFDKEIQRAASKARQSINEGLTSLSPELKQAKEAFANYKQLEGALPSVEGVKNLAQKEAQKAARQIGTLKQAIKSPAHAKTSEIINKLPGGAEALKQGKYLDIATQLANLDMSGKRIPLSKWALILEAATSAPRNVAVNKILPKMLNKAEGVIAKPNDVTKVISQLSKLAVSKGMANMTPDGTIPANNIREERIRSIK